MAAAFEDASRTKAAEAILTDFIPSSADRRVIKLLHERLVLGGLPLADDLLVDGLLGLHSVQPDT